MVLPQQIAVRYTDEDAGYLSVRPVVKQAFTLPELLDMILSVSGKDLARVQQILQSGTVVYNDYRYMWQGFSAESTELQTLLARFPDDDPSCKFTPAGATAVLLEIGGGTQQHVVEIRRKDASEKRLFGKQSPWDQLLNLAHAHPPRYEKYSYARKADLFRITLPFDQGAQLLNAMLEAAPRSLRHRWSNLRPPALVTFICPRAPAPH